MDCRLIEYNHVSQCLPAVQRGDGLVDLIKGKLFHVNLIQLNPVDHYSGKPAMDQSARRFQKSIEAAGIPCTIRLRRGIDIQAGCGQLASKTK